MGIKFNPFTGNFDIVGTSGGGGSSNSFETIQVPAGTSPVATGPSDVLTLADGNGIAISGDAGTDTVTISIAPATANVVAGFDATGEFVSFDNFIRNINTGLDIYQNLSVTDVGTSSIVLNRKATSLTPTNTNTDYFYQDADYINVNPNFDMSDITGKEMAINFSGVGNANNLKLTNEYVNFSSSGTFNDVYFRSSAIGLGNGTDSSSNNNIFYDTMNIDINDNHTSNNLYIYNPSLTVDASASLSDSILFNGYHNIYGSVNNISGFNFNPSIQTGATVTNVSAFYSNPQIDESINNLTIFASNGYGTSAPVNYTGMSVSPNFLGTVTNFQGYQIGTNLNTTITGFTGLNISGQAPGNYYTGVSVSPNNVLDINFVGYQCNPTISGDLTYAAGIEVNMNNVTVYPGVAASLIVQDLTYTCDSVGSDGNNITIEYTGGGTAGSEVVSVSTLAITVDIQPGVSTATQIKAAIEGFIASAVLVNVTVTGVGSNPQTTYSQTNLAGGINSGNKYAANFNGDVSINGALQFNGALSVGKFNAFASEALVDGGGTPSSIHSLITQPTVAANVTIANADLLGVNTASLISIGDNATVTTAFLGVTALGLPAVLSMGTGSTVDRIGGAVFALSLDATGTGGTVDIVSLCRSLAIPNGVTTVNRLYGYEFDLPFGDPGTVSYGLFINQPVNNWIQGTLRLGGTAVSDDLVDSGVQLQVDGVSKLEGGIILGYTEVNSTYTVISSDYVVNCTSGTFAITLPTAVSATGRVYILKNTGTGVITINTTSSQTIDGNASGVLSLVQWDTLQVMSTGANWIVIN